MFLPNESLVRSLHRLNSLFCSLLGIPLNILLIWLIRKRTVKEMRVYSRILLQTCVTDLLFLFVNELTQPIFIIDGPQAIGLLNGPLRNSPTGWNFGGFTFWLFNFYFSIFGICVQFLYRYLTLCRKLTISTIYHLLMLAIASALDASIFVFFFFVAYPPEAKRMLEEEEKLEMLEGPNEEQKNGTRPPLPISFHIDILQLPISWKLWCLCLVMTISTCYAIIGICTARTIQHIRRHLAEHGFSKLQEVNKQLNATLIAQMLLPAFACLIPLFCVANALISSRTSRPILYAQMLCTIPEGWLPVLNPVITILAVKPYRRFFVTRLGPSSPLWARICSVNRIGQWPTSSFLSSRHQIQNQQQMCTNLEEGRAAGGETAEEAILTIELVGEGTTPSSETRAERREAKNIKNIVSGSN